MSETVWQRDGRTVYQLNARGENRLYLQVQPGKDDQDKRVSDEECEALAAEIVEALNAGALRAVLAALNRIASWTEGPLGAHMDEPCAAETARSALAALGQEPPAHA